MRASSPLVLKAPAKINLTLEVLGRRADGYHEVRMLMAGVSLADVLSFEPHARLSLSCDSPRLDCGPANLVLKAAFALRRALGPRFKGAGARIRLRKRIPLGGGLAGGSTDAAATLKGLNRLWRGGLGAAALRRIAATLGSDVPFCLDSDWACATGRGEVLEALSPPARLHLVLANPGFEVSTSWAYGQLGPLKGSARDLSHHAYEAVQSGERTALKAAAHNDLERVTASRYPEIARLERALLKEGAWLSRMSGSGPTVWGLFEDEASAKNACESMKKENILAFAVHTLKGLKR